MTTPAVEFTIDIEPRDVHRTNPDTGLSAARTVYDIKVRDVNGHLLVFSFQGYENRGDARDLAVRLFDGKPARLNVWDHTGRVLDETQYLNDGGDR